MIDRAETERLVLRPLTRADAEALHVVLGDAETMRHYPHPFSYEETEEWIEWCLGSYSQHGHGLYAVVLEEADELIGDCGLTVQMVDDEPFAEVGWHTRRDMWGRGFATEAGAFWRDYAFRELNVERLVSIIRPENRASCRVAEKLGMTVWKETIRGPDWVHRVYSILGPGTATLELP